MKRYGRLRWYVLSAVLLSPLGCGGDNGTAAKDGGAGHVGTGGHAGTAGNAGTPGQGGAAGNVGTVRDGSTDLATDSSPKLNHDAGVDTGHADVVAPAELTATVLDRRETSFQLYWTSPSSDAGMVAGYQVRYAKVPITSANFSDTTVTTSVPFTGTPGAPGSLEGLVVKDLYIENNYYFAVEATNSAGTSIWMQGTTAPVSAHFNLTLFPSTSGTNEELGYSVSADGDLNGDGLSDVLAGTYNSGKAYLFFGTKTVATGAPAVVFSGAAAGFGTAVAQIGDIDGDGRTDLAIADPLNANVVYIYKGRATWPLTLTDVQADYTISGDTSYSTSLLGTSMARIGDFNGDGINDFAIGARNYATFVGRVVIILGKSSGFASVTLPDAVNAITIDGDETLGRPYFGYRVLGLGHFYPATVGTTLIVSAPGTPSSTTANAGHVYAFHGQAGTGAAIALASADSVIAGPASPARIGLVLANLGPILGTLPAVGIGNPEDLLDVSGMNGTAFVAHGTTTTGPFASKTVVTMTGGLGVGNILLGGGLSGQDKGLSLIGNATPDLLVGAASGSTVLTISDGAKLAAKSSPVELTTTAEVSVPLPTGWSSAEGEASLMSDVNGDGYPDFCTANASGPVPGTVAVYW